MLYVLALLTIARLTRLVTADTLTAPARVWLQVRLPSRAAYLIGCPWCASVYLGAAVAVPVVLWPSNRVVLAALVALAGSHVAGWLATREQLDVVLHDAPPDDE